MPRHVTIRLPDDLADAIDERAAAKGLSRSQWVARALRYALAAQGGKVRVTVTEEVL